MVIWFWNLIKVLPAAAKILGYGKWAIQGVVALINNWRYKRKAKKINEADSPQDFENLI